ncbi:eosinophil peroxidase-like [Phyllobates terribilis]|uniref:eosinophil peroxidase-like n=1 Tax=Phyllobates terribilis TaxID=111132 RepID=UPI003CCAD4E1
MPSLQRLSCLLLVFGSLHMVTPSFYDGVEELDNNLILSSVKEAKKLVDTAYKRTRDVLKERLKKRTMTPSDVMTYFKQPVATSRTHIRAADYIETTLDLLTEKVQSIYSRPFNISDLLTANQIDTLHKVSGYAFLHLPKNCQQSQYRTFTGECNNRRFPNFGVSNRPYTRLLPAQYEDGRGLPQGWTEDRRINGFRLPLARAVSNQIIRFPEREQTLDKQRSLMFMQWGQWIDHDLDLAPETPSRSTFLRGIDCDHSCVREQPCYPLRIPPNDPRITNRSDCIPLFRSSPAFQQGSPIREQMNILTSYVDASQVYGSTNKLANMLRNNTNQLGLMAVSNNFSDNGRPYLPFSTNGIEEDFCRQTNESSGLPCFLAGDGRVSEQPGLTAFHTLFVREHNRIAGVLHRMNPRWSGETLFQETRKIIGAVTQKINYKDWLPLLLGSSTSRVLPQYRNYNESVNPGASNVFSLVFRMGHTMIQPFIYRLVDNYRTSQRLPPVPLHLTFFNTWRVVREGGIDPLLRGLMANQAKLNRQNQILVDELREHLFELFKRLGLDLGAINLQRGRDHGLPGYNAWRRFCGLSQPSNVAELAQVLRNRPLAEQFMSLYGTPRNIDIWIGAVAEPLLPNARVGELLACLIGNQFRRTRDGDRFYYERSSEFTIAQKRALDRVTMSRVICDNTAISQVPRNVFLANTFPRNFVNCSQIPTLDLSPWRRRKSGSEVEDSEE